MGVGTRWRAADRAHRRSGLSQQQKYYELILKNTCSSMCVGTVSCMLLLGVYLFYIPELLVPEQNREVTLLIWTHPFGQYRELPDCFALYQISGCSLTDDKLAYPQADAVIIHHRDVASGTADLPPEPRPHAQKWIWMNYESPTHTHRLWAFEGVYNLTMTYRRDSDIFVAYGYLLHRLRSSKGFQNRLAQPLRAISRSRLLRPRLLAWVVSNWSESHARVAFYQQLRRYIQVDVYGNAGQPLPKGVDSLVRLVGQYQFYLALENSQHTDYITEKVWNAVRAGAVPVVLGPSRQNYERFLPPEAFIHVDDFPTVRGLVRYLLMLRRKPAWLMRHLDWRGIYSVHQPAFWTEHYCMACSAVRTTRGMRDAVKDMTQWFHS